MGFIPWNHSCAKYEDTPHDRERLEKAIDNYFLNPVNHVTVTTKDGYVLKIPKYTVCGLSVSLGFVSRQSIYDYMKRKNKCSDMIKKAVHYIESEYEAIAQEKSAVHFLLKNMGWKDSSDLNLGGQDDNPLKVESKNKTDQELIAEIRKITNK